MPPTAIPFIIPLFFSFIVQNELPNNIEIVFITIMLLVSMLSEILEYASTADKIINAIKVNANDINKPFPL